MILVMKIYIVWLIGVIIWNYGFPNASPLEDVVVAIILSFISIVLKKNHNLIVKAKVKLVTVNNDGKPTKIPSVLENKLTIS